MYKTILIILKMMIYQNINTIIYFELDSIKYSVIELKGRIHSLTIYNTNHLFSNIFNFKIII